MKNNKKRIIGFVCTSFDQVAGGLERQIIRTSESLNLKGYKIYIISFTYKIHPTALNEI